MNTPKITNVKEFTAVEGQPGGLDELINAWLRVQSNVTIIDIKYNTAVRQDTLVKLALVLFNKQKSEPSKGLSKAETKAETTPETDENPGARTMVMKIRRDMYNEENKGK